ncbi:MAG: peptide deformylase [Amaricoccus sp.]
MSAPLPGAILRRRPAGRKGRARGRAGGDFVRLVKAHAIAYVAAMALRPILIHPDPRLRKAAAPVGAVDASIRALAEDMLATMYDAPGIGLAATQLGIMKQVFVMDTAAKEDERVPMVFLNPEIVWISDEEAESEEGCLSIPDIYETVTRPARIRLRWMDLDGHVQEQDFADRPAVCVQHELDHLKGKLFIDYLSPVKRAMITARMKKLKRERARG